MPHTSANTILILLGPKILSVYAQLSVENHKFNHFKTSRQGAPYIWQWVSLKCDGLPHHGDHRVRTTTYSRDCECSRRVFLRRSFSELLYSYGWENLETFSHASWLVLAYPRLYNCSFENGIQASIKGRCI